MLQLIGIIALVFYHRRQKTAKSETSDSVNNNRHLQELLDVDWDKTDSHYKKMPATIPSITSNDTKFANISTHSDTPSTVQQHYTAQLLGNNNGKLFGQHANSSANINIDISVKDSFVIGNAIIKPNAK